MTKPERQRLNAVSRFKQLDADVTNDLNDLVKLVANICEVPIALVTLLDHDTQWFKASVGIDIDCTARGIAFCNHTIEQIGIYTVPDALIHDDFKDNPLVTGHPNVRFYAGAPLITKDGQAVGSLCVVDLKTRQLTAQQEKALLVMARQVVNLIELSLSLNTLAEKHQKEQEHVIAISESELKLKAIFDSTNDTQMLIGKNYEVLAYNKSAETFIYTAYNHKVKNGDNILQYTDKVTLNQFKKYFSVALTGRTIKREWMLMKGTPFACWKVTTFTPVKNAKDEVIGVALNASDITHHKKQEAYINVQNEALNRIAIMQSHELRRPVASLLAMMDLIRMEDINFTYLNMMELTINELDEKIRGIVKDSENTLQGRHLSIVA